MARPKLNKPTLAEVKYIAHKLAQELMTHDEPIPPFDTRFPDRLESCLKAPFQTFQKRSLYPSFEMKASTLFYFMIKSHPFQNGNKRVAVVTLYYFLASNGRKLQVENLKLYEFAKKVAASDPAKNAEVIEEIRDFVTQHTVISTDSVPSSLIN
ncbi:type II toxin-antitoxin system death-on-curing family toxin [Acetobacteraceae bacterium]|nr:type II toxin-antitoxin system death-on-curing family toxin [Candidatus Parcubacteria bacterium]